MVVVLVMISLVFVYPNVNGFDFIFFNCPFLGICGYMSLVIVILLLDMGKRCYEFLPVVLGYMWEIGCLGWWWETIFITWTMFMLFLSTTWRHGVQIFVCVSYILLLNLLILKFGFLMMKTQQSLKFSFHFTWYIVF